MSRLIRAFIAVHVPPPRALASVIATLAGMGSAVKAVDEGSLHVTLKFLGDTDPQQISEIARLMAIAAERHPLFDARIVGLGAFPTPQRPNVVWAGLQNADPLSEIADALETAFEPLGFARERRAFHPHVTLARVRSRPPAQLAALLQDQAAREFGAVPVKAVELIQSEPGPKGSKYTTLFTASLEPAPGS